MSPADRSELAADGTPTRGTWALWLLLLTVWLAITVPLALGRRTLFVRDVFATHVHFKAVGARALAEGAIPAFNPAWGLGQPFRGNPNTLAFYPGNALYLALPFWSAFNLHYALHWLLALLTFHALARELGMGRPAALAAGLTWAGCGWTMSALTFYNILTVTAWWPLALLGAVRGGRRGVALGGLGCGLALLGGEPVTATLGLVPLLLAAGSRHGWRRGLATAFGIGAVGLLVAAPQVVETLRVVGHTVRGAGDVPSPAGFYSLRPFRWLEILVPPPSGWGRGLGRWLRIGEGDIGRAPYVASLYGGIVGVWLASIAARRHRLWTALAAAGLLLATLGGFAGPALRDATFGLFRYPEKLLLWWAIGFAILVGRGLDEVLGRPDAGRRRAAAIAAVLLGALIALRFLPADVFGVSPAALASRLVVSVALIVGAALLARRGSTVLVLLQLAGLAMHAPLWVTDRTEPYLEAPEWARRLGPGAPVVPSTVRSPFRHPPPPFRSTGRRSLPRATHELLEPPLGVVHGLSYPLASDLEGMHSPPMAAVLARVPRASWRDRVRWSRVVGAEALVLSPETRKLPLPVLDSRTILGVRVDLLRLRPPAPLAWWPDEVVAAADLAAAVATVEGVADPERTPVVTADRPPRQTPGRVVGAAESWDRLSIEVDSEGGGLVAVRRAYQPLLRASTGGEALATVPLNAALLGVRVPPGRRTIVVEVDDRPTIAALALSAVAVLAALAAARCPRRRRLRLDTRHPAG